MGQPTRSRGSQLLHGVLDICLLALIAEEERYGYEIVRQLEERGLHLVSEGSIYPLLSRLQKSGLVQGYEKPSSNGPPRKYYRVTPEGRNVMRSGLAEWNAFVSGVRRVTKGAS